jgi:hypothetical protein
MFIEGDLVTYKFLEGVVDFVCEKSIAILIKKGEHRVQDVKVIVPKSEFDQVHYQDEK